MQVYVVQRRISDTHEPEIVGAALSMAGAFRVAVKLAGRDLEWEGDNGRYDTHNDGGLASYLVDRVRVSGVED